MSIEQVDSVLTYITGISVILSSYLGHNFIDILTALYMWVCMCVKTMLQVYHRNTETCGQIRTSRLWYVLQIPANFRLHLF